jgi:hypothetical protein
MDSAVGAFSHTLQAGGGLFDTASLHARLGYTEAAVTEAHRVLYSHEDPEAFDAAQLREFVTIAATTEHEYFHCRHFLSSSTGYLLFSIRQYVFADIAHNLRANPMLQLHRSWREAPTLATLIPPTFSAEIGNELRLQLIDAFHWLRVNEVLNRPDHEAVHQLRAFYAFCGSTINQHCFGVQAIQPGELDPAPYMPSLSRVNAPSEEELRAAEEGPTLIETLEGLTLWKEYLMVSRALWTRRFGYYFSTAHREWLAASWGKPMYRSAVDLIFDVTKCNMSMALPGILLDIALCAPWYSKEQRTWTELHPTLRLVAMLRNADVLPASLQQIDNVDGAREDVYRDVEARLQKRLGWRRVEDNLKDTKAAIAARLAYGALISSAAASVGAKIMDLGIFYDRRFLMGINGRLPVLSTYLFPENNRDSEVIGDLTRPPLSVFADVARLNLWITEGEVEGSLYAEDVVATELCAALSRGGSIHPKHLRSALDLHRRLAPLIRTTFGDKSDFSDTLGRCFGEQLGDAWRKMHRSA